MKKPTKRSTKPASAKQAAASRPIELKDGLVNELAGINGPLDRSRNTRWEPNKRRLTQQQIEDMLAHSGLLERFIYRPIEDMLRKGITFTKLSPDEIDDLTDYLDEIDFWHYIKRALGYMRAFGGGAVYIDNGELKRDKPISPMGHARVRRLVAFDPDSLSADSYAMHGEPSHWVLHGVDPEIPAGHLHCTRLLLFRGRQISAARTWANAGWGDSETSKVQASHEALLLVRYIIPNIAITYEQGVFKFEGLTEQLKTKHGKEVITAKALDLQAVASFLNAHLIDSKDSFERVGAPLDGLSDMMDQAERQYVQDTGTPHTIALGESPGSTIGGAGAGDSQHEDYYNLIAAMQMDYLYRPLRQFFNSIKKLLRARYKRAFKDLRFVFNPLYALTEKEQRDLDQTEAKTDEIYIKNGVVGEEEVREKLQKKGSYNITSLELPEPAEDLGEGLEPDPKPEATEQEPENEDESA